MPRNMWRHVGVLLLLVLPLAAWSQGLPLLNVTGGGAKGTQKKFRALLGGEVE